MSETILSGRYLGIPEARADAIQELSESLLFATTKNRPGAFILAGPRRVGKTSAVQELEKTLMNAGQLYGSDYSRVSPTSKTFPNSGTLIFDEIPVQKERDLKRIASLLDQQKRIVLDVVNSQFPIGDPRNNIEAEKIIRTIFPHKLLHLRQLFAVQDGFGIEAKIPSRSGHTIDFSKKPGFDQIKADHNQRVVDITSHGVFVAGETYLQDDGSLATDLIWTGKPTFGSIDGQTIVTSIPKSFFS